MQKLLQSDREAWESEAEYHIFCFTFTEIYLKIHRFFLDMKIQLHQSHFIKAEGVPILGYIQTQI